MNVARAAAYWRREHQLLALLTAGHLDPIPWLGATPETNRLHQWHQDSLLQRLNPNLNVDTVLGLQTRHRGRPDVVDGQRTASQRRVQLVSDQLELGRPSGSVVDNDDT
ncbi:MAG: hypothetical protein QOF10_935 [Kribbellaceae bacterium]|nr:hypothetical protein [Kribbellaceae bacterium]